MKVKKLQNETLARVTVTIDTKGWFGDWRINREHSEASLSSHNAVVYRIVKALLQSDVVQKGEAGRSLLCVVPVGRCGCCSASLLRHRHTLHHERGITYQESRQIFSEVHWDSGKLLGSFFIYAEWAVHMEN